VSAFIATLPAAAPAALAHLHAPPDRRFRPRSCGRSATLLPTSVIRKLAARRGLIQISSSLEKQFGFRQAAPPFCSSGVEFPILEFRQTISDTSRCCADHGEIAVSCDRSLGSGDASDLPDSISSRNPQWAVNDGRIRHLDLGRDRSSFCHSRISVPAAILLIHPVSRGSFLNIFPLSRPLRLTAVAVSLVLENHRLFLEHHRCLRLMAPGVLFATITPLDQPDMSFPR